MAREIARIPARGGSKMEVLVVSRKRRPARTGECCDQLECRRIEPIGIFLGDFDGRVFAALRSQKDRDNGDGTARMIATEKHDVTKQMQFFIRRNASWVRAVLREGGE